MLSILIFLLVGCASTPPLPPNQKQQVYRAEASYVLSIFRQVLTEKGYVIEKLDAAQNTLRASRLSQADRSYRVNYGSDGIQNTSLGAEVKVVVVVQPQGGESQARVDFTRVERYSKTPENTLPVEEGVVYQELFEQVRRSLEPRRRISPK